MKERNFKFTKFNSFVEEKEKPSKNFSNSLPKLTKPLNKYDPQEDLSSQDGKHKNSKLVTIFMDGERFREVLFQPSKFEVFSTLKKNGKWEVKESKHALTDVKTSNQLDLEFQSNKIPNCFLFRRVDSDLHFKSLQEIVKDFCKLTEKFEVSFNEKHVKHDSSFIERHEIFSENEDVEDLNETGWFNNSSKLFFLQNEEFDVDEGEWNVVTRERSKPVY